MLPEPLTSSGVGAGGTRKTYDCGAARSLSKTPLHAARGSENARIIEVRHFIAESPRPCSSAHTGVARGLPSGCATTRRTPGRRFAHRAAAVRFRAGCRAETARDLLDDRS